MIKRLLLWLVRKEIICLKSKYNTQIFKLESKNFHELQAVKSRVNRILEGCSTLKFSFHPSQQKVKIVLHYDPKVFQRSGNPRDLELLAAQMGEHVCRTIIQENIKQ